MRKTKKQLLGLAGLAAVGIMTAVAYAMPSPNAAAANEYGYECNDNDSDPTNDCAKYDSGSQVQVTVTEGNPAISTLHPQDGSTFIDPLVEIATNYSEVTKIDYYLTYVDQNGSTQRVDLNSYSPTETSGIHKFEVDITQYGYGEYTLHSTAHGYNGAVREDTVKFNYRAIRANFTGETADNGDPVLKIESNNDVDKLLVSIYDKSGKPLFVDENGKEVPIKLDRDDIDPTTGEVLVTLPFEQYGAPAGEYTAVVVAYNDKDAIISMVTATTDYKFITPEVPDTGSNFFGDLNITRVDYLITGLIVFGMVAGFALYLVCRKSKSSRR